MHDRGALIIPVTLAFGLLAWLIAGLRTGRILYYLGTAPPRIAERHEEPRRFWFMVGILIILIVGLAALPLWIWESN